MRLVNFWVERIDDKVKIVFAFYHQPTNTQFLEEMFIDGMIGSTPKNLSKSFAKWVKWLKNMKKEKSL